MVPKMVLVADGSRDPGRREALHDLAEAVSERREAHVVSAFGAPEELNETVASITGPLVAVPAFLAGGDTASAELLAALDLEGRFDACATVPLGATPSIVANFTQRLREAGWRHGDAVVLAADGAVDHEERHQVATAARMLSRRVRTPVQVGYMSSWAPSVGDAVTRLHEHGHRRVAVVAWRLVEGADQRRLRELDVTAVTDPLWPAPFLVDTLLAQHRAANARLVA